jgi:hypothetical protein
MSPMLGLSPIRKRFKERMGRECAEVLMGLDDALHIPKGQHPEILARYSEAERATIVRACPLSRPATNSPRCRFRFIQHQRRGLRLSRFER